MHVYMYANDCQLFDKAGRGNNSRKKCLNHLLISRSLAVHTDPTQTHNTSAILISEATPSHHIFGQYPLLVVENS